MRAIASHFKLLWYGLLATLLLLSVVLSMLNSASLSTVSIKLKDGIEEHQDKTIPLVSDPQEKLPDYTLSYLYDERWQTIGTAVNTSAKDWIDFEISDVPNMTLVQAIRIVDKDTVENDLLEEIQLVDKTPNGKKFDYQIETKNSFKSGMAWFATTALGKAIFGAIALAIILVILSYVGAPAV